MKKLISFRMLCKCCTYKIVMYGRGKCYRRLKQSHKRCSSKHCPVWKKLDIPKYYKYGKKL